MLGHLIDNAYEAMPGRKGTIALAPSTDARGWVVLELRDTGRGMDDETLVRAVEPFFSTKPGHLGVGLSIANGIWRRHRGTLSIRSQPGEGTAVRLCVEPIAGVTDRDPDEPSARRRIAALGAALGRRGAGPRTGSWTVTRVPWPTAELIAISPHIWSTISRQIARPRPLPSIPERSSRESR